MTPLTKQQVINKLCQIGYERPFTVTFTKVNGEQRIMLAQMERSSHEPSAMGTPEEYKGPLSDLEALPVKDLEKGQWRSFRLDSVVALEV